MVRPCSFSVDQDLPDDVVVPFDLEGTFSRAWIPFCCIWKITKRCEKRKQKEKK